VIQDSQARNVTYAGVNWPGSLDVMIPEGLQYQSAQNIVTKIKSLGMNSIRLTYAIEMIDQIVSRNGTDVPIKEALTSTLGPSNGSAVFSQILQKNPAFNENTTRLQVWSVGKTEAASWRS
jgi:hypothetical protein